MESRQDYPLVGDRSMIHAHAVLCCDAPGCSASVAGLKPLRYGQLNPLDVAGLNATAAAGGWAARWIEDEVRHYCPEHVPPRETATKD